MKITSTRSLLGFMLVIIAGSSFAKTINRIINNSDQNIVSVAPVNALSNTLVQGPAIVLYMKAFSDKTFDVTLVEPLEVDSEVIYTVGTASDTLDIPENASDENVLIIHEHGNAALQPLNSVADIEGSTQVEVVRLEPVAAGDKKEKGIRNTFITKVINDSEATTILVLPAHHASLFEPTGNLGYVLRANEPTWGERPTLEAPLFLGSDIKNTELIIITDNSTARLSGLVEGFSANNVLHITNENDIEIKPAALINR